MPLFALRQELCCCVPSPKSLELKRVLVLPRSGLHLTGSWRLCTPHRAMGSRSPVVDKLSLEEGEFGPFPASGTHTHRPTCLGDAHVGWDFQGGKVPGAKLMLQVLQFPGENPSEMFLLLPIPTRTPPCPRPICSASPGILPAHGSHSLCSAGGHGRGQTHQHIHLSRQQAEKLNGETRLVTILELRFFFLLILWLLLKASPRELSEVAQKLRGFTSPLSERNHLFRQTAESIITGFV